VALRADGGGKGGARRPLLERFRLDGRVALITGASAGLGAGFALDLADAGADVVVAGRRQTRLEDVAAAVEDSGRCALVVTTDVSDPEQCAALVDAAMERFGRVDVLVNNAGVGTAVPALKERPEEFRHVIDVNLLGTYWMAQSCARVMQPGSSIVNVGSVLAMTSVGLPQAAYTASKAGVIGLTRDLAQQWMSRRGIRVNAVAPGYFRTEMTSYYGAKEWARVEARTLTGRTGEQHEVSAAVLFLASEASSYVVGQTLVVDGGLTIT
jgi:NAD(P)-dependent dehydrogenase (short-subunit alcohol dehydrogenase family)